VSVLRPALDQYFPEQMGVRIIAEPGRYFAASAFTLAVNIIAKRTVTSSDSTSSSPGDVGGRFSMFLQRAVTISNHCFD